MPGAHPLQSLFLSLPWRSWPRLPPSKKKQNNNTRKWWFSKDSAALAFPAGLREKGRMEGDGRKEGGEERNARRR